MPKVLRTRKVKIAKLRKRRKKNKSFLFLRVVIVLMFLGVGVFNLLQINYKLISAYEADDLKNRIEKLENEKEVMELKASKLQSLASIYERLDSAKMEAIEKIEYLKQKEEMAMAR
ncbi:MAG: hypothetical protein U9O55_01810 [Patescibacteria group bacterium]|nr:hypothetical protein [Patescibacteria group bacterium]